MPDSIFLNMLVTWGGTFIAGAFGVGVGYATIREQLKNFRVEFENYKHNANAAIVAASNISNNDMTYVKERIAKIEGKAELQVGQPRCTEMQTACQGRISDQLATLSEQVIENRDTMVDYMTSIQKFVGRVELFMERYGKP